MNLRFFGLYRDYSNSLALSNVGEPVWSWISKNPYSSLEENKFHRCLFTFSLKSKIRQFQVVVVQKRQRNVKKRDACANLLFCLLNLLFFDVLIAVALWDRKVSNENTKTIVIFFFLCMSKWQTSRENWMANPKRLNNSPSIEAEKWMVWSTGVMALFLLNTGTWDAKNSWEYFVDAIFCFVRICLEKKDTNTE